MKENAEFILELANLVKKHYPDGHMRVSDVTIYFGIVLAGALAGSSAEERDQAARMISSAIKNPNETLRKLFPK